jgi:hypothetical protein
MVDGAHAATGASAWTIPVTDQFGQIFAERHNAGQIKRRFTQASHGLTTGQAVAIVITGAAVGVPGTITGAQANSTSTEAFGIVDRVISTSEFSVTMKGYMDLSPNGLLGIGRPVTGQVYYLDWAVKGGLTTNTNVPQGYLYQPLFMPLGGSAGIVYGNEADVIFPFAQDQVYVRGMIPIGAIQPYAGGLAGLSLGLSGGSIPVSDVQYNDNWMPCDGRALSATGTSGFVDLFNLINYTYSMRGVVESANGALNTVIRPDRGTANLGSLGLGSLAGVVRVIKRGAAGSDSPNIVKTYSYTGLTADGTTITLKGLTTNNVTIASNIVVDILSPKDGIYFFAPDLRGKAPFGEYAPYGARGEGFSLTAGATGGTATGDGGLFTNYLIRAKRDSDAMILTGHNHDSRYLRSDISNGAAVSTTLSLQNVLIAGTLTGVASTYTGLGKFNAGITSNNLYVTNGVTFAGTSVHTGLGTFNAGITSTHLHVSNGVTFAGTSVHTGLGTFNGGINSSHLNVNNGATFAGGLVVSSGTITGTLATAAQTNITSVGTLTSLSSSGLVTANGGINSSHLIVNNGVTFASTSVHTGLGTFNAGITSNNLYVTNGVTFASTSVHTGLGTFNGGINANTLNVSGLSKLKRISVFDGITDLHLPDIPLASGGDPFEYTILAKAKPKVFGSGILTTAAVVGYANTTSSGSIYGALGWEGTHSFYGIGAMYNSGLIQSGSNITPGAWANGSSPRSYISTVAPAAGASFPTAGSIWFVV